MVTSSLCATTVVPGGGVAAMPYGYPAPYGAMYPAPYGAPVGMNAYQAPTVWQGDHVVSGGQPEWAAEDAAQHALNLANWRIKLLQVTLLMSTLACWRRMVKMPGFTSFLCAVDESLLRSRVGAAACRVSATCACVSYDVSLSSRSLSLSLSPPLSRCVLRSWSNLVDCRR